MFQPKNYVCRLSSCPCGSPSHHSPTSATNHPPLLLLSSTHPRSQIYDHSLVLPIPSTASSLPFRHPTECAYAAEETKWDVERHVYHGVTSLKEGEASACTLAATNTARHLSHDVPLTPAGIQERGARAAEERKEKTPKEQRGRDGKIT
jgi:hypothetical protein